MSTKTQISWTKLEKKLEKAYKYRQTTASQTDYNSKTAKH